MREGYYMNTQNRPLVLYHSPCADGFTAAWVLWKKHPDWEYHAAKYGDPLPDVTDRCVYMVDFSCKRPVMLELASKAKWISVIDHHKTAEAELVDLPDNVHVHFDMTRSGAALAWRFVFPGKPIPELVKFVEDRDLWKFQYEESKAISEYIFSYDYTFENWNRLHESLEDHDFVQNTVLPSAEAILRKHNKDVNELKALKHRIVINAHEVWAANVPYICASDLAGQLSEGEPFAATYFYDPSQDKYTFSLRSRGESGLDVSEIAKKFGGGGHKNAAGFSATQIAFAEMRIQRKG